MTIADAPKVADAIDPRVTCAELHSRGNKPAILIYCSRETLIAASDLLRTLSAPLSGEAEELVKRLIGNTEVINLLPLKLTLGDLQRIAKDASEAADLITSLSLQVQVARKMAIDQEPTETK